MRDAFLQSIREEYPNENTTRFVFADWCLENQPELEDKLRTNLPIINCLRIKERDGYGYSFIRYGFGYGNGIGYGYGFGNGTGYGYGNGNGSGHGYGYKYKYINPILNMPKLHSNQLIFLPNSFVFCGYVQKHIQPYQFKIINASLIYYHNSTWEKVANNTNRNIHSRKFGTITIGPQFFHSIDWIGDLP